MLHQSENLVNCFHFRYSQVIISTEQEKVMNVSASRDRVPALYDKALSSNCVKKTSSVP